MNLGSRQRVKVKGFKERKGIMKKLTAIILSVCLGAAVLAGCQAGTSDAPAASGLAPESRPRQEDKKPVEGPGSRKDSPGNQTYPNPAALSS